MGQPLESERRLSLWPLALLGILGLASWFRSKANTQSQQSVKPVQAQDNTNRNSSIRKPEDNRATTRTVPQGQPSIAKNDNPPNGGQQVERFRKAGGAWISLGTFLVVLAYAVIARNQWQEMIRATNEAAKTADAAHQQLEASERPWIKIIDVQTTGDSPIVPALSFQRSPNWPPGMQQATFQLDIAYKNIGHSVARVTADFELLLPLWKNGYSDVILADEKKFCDSSARVSSTPTLSVINFPGDESYHWSGAGAAIVNAEHTNYFSDRSPGVGYILPVVAVCVSYQFAGSPKVYQTRALYEVFRKDDRTRFFEAGVGVPAHKIFLIRNSSGDAAY